jgi:hypothetical protein
MVVEILKFIAGLAVGVLVAELVVRYLIDE